MLLSEYDYELRYRSGKANIGADIVSRINTIKVPYKFEEIIPNKNTLSNMNDAEIYKLMKDIHILCGHPGITQTYETIKKIFKIKT